jgi:hypothetical protein
MRDAYTLTLVLSFGAGIGCGGSEPDPLRLASPVVSECPGGEALSRFRGNGSGSDSPDYWLRPLYSALLAAANEAPLWCGGSAELESYRVVRIPSNRSATVVRVERTSNRWQVTSTVFDQVPGPLSVQTAAPRIVGAKTFHVTPEAIRPFIDAIAKADFWTAPVHRSSDEIDDGVVWTIEGRMAGRYRAVSRENVDEAFIRAAQLLLEAASISAAHSSSTSP